MIWLFFFLPLIFSTLLWVCFSITLYHLSSIICLFSIFFSTLSIVWLEKKRERVFYIPITCTVEDPECYGQGKLQEIKESSKIMDCRDTGDLFSLFNLERTWRCRGSMIAEKKADEGKRKKKPSVMNALCFSLVFCWFLFIILSIWLLFSEGVINDLMK